MEKNEQVIKMALRMRVEDNAQSMLDMKVANKSMSHISELLNKDATIRLIQSINTGNALTGDEINDLCHRMLEAINAQFDCNSNLTSSTPKLREKIVSIEIPNLLRAHHLAGLNDDLIPDMQQLEICIDAALESPNPARAMAEFCTPGMLLGNAVENNHHLGMALAQFGLEGIERQKEIAEEEAMTIECPDSSHFVIM